MTPASHTSGLASLEPGTGVGISLVSRLQKEHEAGMGYAGSDMLLVDIEDKMYVVYSDVQGTHTPCSFNLSSVNVHQKWKIRVMLVHMFEFIPRLVFRSGIQLEISPKAARLEIQLPMIDAL